mgnify:CR=1 FL=1
MKDGQAHSQPGGAAKPGFPGDVRQSRFAKQQTARVVGDRPAVQPAAYLAPSEAMKLKRLLGYTLPQSGINAVTSARQNLFPSKHLCLK